MDLTIDEFMEWVPTVFGANTEVKVFCVARRHKYSWFNRNPSETSVHWTLEINEVTEFEGSNLVVLKEQAMNWLKNYGVKSLETVA
jgi:hypothetical protein